MLRNQIKQIASYSRFSIAFFKITKLTRGAYNVTKYEVLKTDLKEVYIILCSTVKNEVTILR